LFDIMLGGHCLIMLMLRNFLILLRNCLIMLGGQYQIMLA
jgi:hypothetical protein